MSRLRPAAGRVRAARGLVRRRGSNAPPNGARSSASRCPMLFIDYLAPSLDTTISAIGNALWLFATHPDQWQLLRDEPAPGQGRALNEALRLESPISCFTRVAAVDAVIGGVDIPAGSRVMVSFASANRDERRWHDPERFDITRESAGHLAFGHGEHACVGMGLARLEGTAVLTALVERVATIELDGPPQRKRNNLIRVVRIPARGGDTVRMERIDVHAHFVPGGYRDAAVDAGHGQPDGMSEVAMFSRVLQDVDPEADVLRDVGRLHFDLAGFPLPRHLDELLLLTTMERLHYGSDYPFSLDFALERLAAELDGATVAEDLAANTRALFPGIGDALTG